MSSFATRHGQAGLFAIAARFNHACHPGHNVDFAFDEAIGCLILTVRRTEIVAGQELTICYGKDRTPLMLYLWYGFRCFCGTCPGISKEKIARMTEQW